MSGTVQRRRERATRAVGALGAHRSDRQVLAVQCRHAHHVAAVYETDAGPVYVSRTGPHAHGSRDFIDTGDHGSRGGAEYVDLLDAPSGDDLPAWCDCGPRTLSRAGLRRSVAERTGTLRVD